MDNMTTLERAKAQAKLWAIYRDEDEKSRLNEDEKADIAGNTVYSHWQDIPIHDQYEIKLAYAEGYSQYPHGESPPECECGDDFAFYLIISPRGQESYKCGSCYNQYLEGWCDLANMISEDYPVPEIQSFTTTVDPYA